MVRYYLDSDIGDRYKVEMKGKVMKLQIEVELGKDEKVFLAYC